MKNYFFQFCYSEPQPTFYKGSKRQMENKMKIHVFQFSLFRTAAYHF